MICITFGSGRIRIKRINGVEVARSSAGKSALFRALQVLECFDPNTPELSLKQITARAGIAPSTAHGIVSELVSLGLLERRGKELVLGVRLWEVAVRAPGVFGLRETALPYLQEVRDRLKEHAQLGILQGSEVLYLERLSAPESTVNFTAVGSRLPWYATSSGFVLMADTDPDELEGFLRRARPRVFDEPDAGVVELRRRLAEARRLGYMVTPGYIHPNSTAVAVPVIGPYRRAVAALAVVVATKGFNERQVLGALIPAAHQISRELRSSLDA